MEKRSLKVLVVEDDPDDFLLTSGLLDEISVFECETEWAASYAAAKTAIAEKTFDLCLVDYDLGARNGLELVREAVAGGFRAPMILLTGQEDRAVDLEAAAAGAADYLVKGTIQAVLLERSIRYALERRRAEESLEAAAGRERAMVENALNLICTVDAEGKFVAVNPACFKMFGYQPEELIGTAYVDLIVPEDVEKSTAAARVMAGEEINNFENRCRRKNGAVINLLWTTYWSKNEQLMFAVAHDITERKQAQAAIRRSEEKYRNILETIQEGYFECNLRGDLVFFNDALCDLLGYRRDELTGLNYKQFTDAENAEKIRADFNEVYETKQPQRFSKWAITRKNGEKRFEESSVALARNETGETIGFRGIVRDVTEQRRADAALRESEYKLRTLLESMREGLLQVDNDDRIVFVNDCFCEMVDYTSEELMGTVWTQLMFDDDGRDSVKQVNRRRREGHADNYEISLKKKSGEMLWVIVGGAPILDAEGNVAGSLGVFTNITTRKRAEEQLLHDAFHDGLTGLANRTLFNDHLQMTIDRTKRDKREMFAVLFLDFDRFKVINDSLGHTEGDNLLKQIARRLESSLRSGDLVARLGGDEFTILINRIGDSSVALRVAERIQKNLQVPFEIGGGEIIVTASIGIALSTTGRERAEDMLRDADIAMYRAKFKGKARHQVFDREMHEQASSQLRLETEMRQALERGEFTLAYQPIINLETAALVGFESLVRWQHPRRGQIMPLEFIGAAEENNFILPLGKWILRESCRQMRLWQENHPAAAHLIMSVNLSSKQFQQFDLAEQIADTLEQTRLDPRFLKLEITESHIMDNTESAVITMSKLRACGIELSLDDFGTGYSSLSYLHRLPVNFLKIDRSFVMRMIENAENFEIVRTIIKLGQNLKMQVIAEGIETEEQLARLKMLRCEYGQGYYFAKPLTTAAAEKFIGENVPNTAYQPNESISSPNL